MQFQKWGDLVLYWIKSSISVVLCFTAAIAGQMNYWSIKNKIKWFSNNLKIWFPLKVIHITLEITRHGGKFTPMDSTSTAKRQDFNPPGEIKNCLKIKTCFFNQWVTSTHLAMGLLAHSWLEIMEFSQILIIPTFWHWKIAA